MAVTLSIVLNDQEEARILEVASLVAPGSTPAQIKAWAEKQAKNGLRDSVLSAWTDYQIEAMNSDWPIPPASPAPGP